jgi:hypothetical protein
LEVDSQLYSNLNKSKLIIPVCLFFANIIIHSNKYFSNILSILT